LNWRLLFEIISEDAEETEEADETEDWKS